MECSMRDGLKAIHIYGMCPENLCPYDITQFRVRPHLDAYSFGEKHRMITYFRIPQILSQLRQCSDRWVSFCVWNGNLCQF